MMAGTKTPGAASSEGPDSAVKAAAPGPVERGRYAVFELPDGGLHIARSGPLCDRCAGCGCGDQLDPIKAPGMLVKLARQAAAGDANLVKQIKAFRDARR